MIQYGNNKRKMQLALQIADSTAASGISAMNFVISLEHGEYS